MKHFFGKGIMYSLATLVAIVFCVVACNKVETTVEEKNNKSLADVKRMTDAEIKEYVKISSDLIAKIHDDSAFIDIKHEAGRLDYVKGLLKKEKNIKAELPVNFLGDVKTQMNAFGAGLDLGKTSNKARTSGLVTSYTSNQMQFMSYVDNEVGNSQSKAEFQTNISRVRRELVRGNWSYLDNTGESSAMYNYIGMYEDYVAQWPENLDNFEPFGQYRGIYSNPNCPSCRALGPCRGFFKILCIAKWTAFIGAAGSVSGPGGTILGAAAGYWIGRCCKCGCTCDIVVCDF